MIRLKMSDKKVILIRQSLVDILTNHFASAHGSSIDYCTIGIWYIEDMVFLANKEFVDKIIIDDWALFTSQIFESFPYKHDFDGYDYKVYRNDQA